MKNITLSLQSENAMKSILDQLGGVGTQVNVKHFQGDAFEHDFIGTITGIHRYFITVKDQDGNAWDCEPFQIRINTNE